MLGYAGFDIDTSPYWVSTRRRAASQHRSTTQQDCPWEPHFIFIVKIKIAVTGTLYQTCSYTNTHPQKTDKDSKSERNTLIVSAHQVLVLFTLKWREKNYRCVLDLLWLERNKTTCHVNRAILWVKQMDDGFSPSNTGENVTCLKCKKALTSATGTPSGGRQCNTIMPFRGTSVPWGSCSKFFRRSRQENKQPAL